MAEEVEFDEMNEEAKAELSCGLEEGEDAEGIRAEGDDAE